MDASIESIKRQLQQLQELRDSGVLAQPQYDEGRATLERRLLDQVLSGAAASEASAPAANPASAPGAQASAAPVTPSAPITGATVTGARPSMKLWAGVGLMTVVIAVGGYLWKGSPLAIGGAAPAAAQAGGEGPHATDMQQIAAMVEKLAERMQQQPGDAEGWAMLGRSYSVLGRHEEALAAYEKAVALRKDDAPLLADYADALAMRNNRNLAGEPMKVVERALKLEPNNLKALAMAGSYAFDQKDYAGAARYWERLVKTGPADNPMVQQMRGALDEARSLAGLPPMPALQATGSTTPAPAAPGATADAQAKARPGASVSGTVSLSPALRAQAQPDDTVFIFARAAEGARMPLAILRKKVRDLPVSFTLDDSLAMSGAAALSSASKVIVGARVSRSGNAMPQPGDLSGQSAVVPLGAQGLKVEIAEQVKP